MTSCPAAGPDALVQVTALKREIDSLGGPPAGRLLVGLGDNFAPELASRFIYTTSQPTPDNPNPAVIAKRKDVLFWDGSQWLDSRTAPASAFSVASRQAEASGTSTIPMDNVACFLSYAGYDALVPGKHDFYFGPERLRQIARLLAAQPARTVMLGANLAISTSPNAAQKPAPRVKNPLKADLPDAVYPWIQRFVIHNAYDGVSRADQDQISSYSPRAIIQEADSSHLEVLDAGVRSTVPITVSTPQACIDSPAPTCAGGSPLDVDWNAMKGRHPDRTLVFARPAGAEWLAPGPHQLAAVGTVRGFEVQRAFFQHPAATRGAAQVPPYLVKSVGAERVAVFGVVEPALKEYIGLLNYSWVNVDANLRVDPGLQTQLLISDPVAALDQVLDACDADPLCRGARKVLLAQMRYDQAQLLAGRFRSRGLELVLAETDQRHAATEEDRTQLDGSPVVLSPGGIYDANDPNDLRVRAYRAVIGHVEVETRKRLSVSVRVHTTRTGVGSRGQTYAKGSRASFGEDALAAMRSRYHTDVALLQKRDLFDLPAVLANARRPINRQQDADTVFWKGDFVVRVDLTGDTLKSIMEQSDKFDAADSNALSSDLETGRGLLRRGIFQDTDKNWTINGQPLDGGKQYSVALTDYLAYGDTGYVGLKSASLPKAADLKVLVPLSELACRAIFQDSSCEQKDIEGDMYFDRTGVRPFSNRPADAFGDLGQWLRSAAPLVSPREVAPDDREKKAQDRRYWTITLEKADLKYSSYDHTPQSQAQLKSQFAGVPQSQILTANSVALAHDVRLRAVHSGKHIEKFLLFEDAYERDYKQADNDVRIQSQPANMIAGEGGVNWRLLPQHRALPALKLAASLRVESNFAHPLTAFTINGDNSGNNPAGTLVRPLPRLTRFPLKLGFRVENQSSWLEFGYQYSHNRNFPSGYNFYGPTGVLEGTCPANLASQPLGNCVTTNTAITLASNVQIVPVTRNQPGLYLNFKIAVPLYHLASTAVSYVMENTGNLYLVTNQEYSLDPRYLETWTHSLNFKLPFANLSIAPQMSYLFYKNMVDHNTLRSTATSVALQYNFTWHSGMKWGDALRYQDPNLKPK